MADCYQQGCILSEGHECLHMSAENATAGELRHQLAERDKRIAGISNQLQCGIDAAEFEINENPDIADRMAQFHQALIAEYGNEKHRAERAEARVKELEGALESAVKAAGIERTDAISYRKTIGEAIRVLSEHFFAIEPEGDLPQAVGASAQLAQCVESVLAQHRTAESLLAALISAAEPLEAWLTQKAAAIEKLRLDSICLEQYEVGDLDLGVLRALAAAVEKAREGCGMVGNVGSL